MSLGTWLTHYEQQRLQQQVAQQQLLQQQEGAAAQQLMMQLQLGAGYEPPIQGLFGADQGAAGTAYQQPLQQHEGQQGLQGGGLVSEPLPFMATLCPGADAGMAQADWMDL